MTRLAWLLLALVLVGCTGAQGRPPPSVAGRWCSAEEVAVVLAHEPLGADEAVQVTGTLHFGGDDPGSGLEGAVDRGGVVVLHTVDPDRPRFLLNGALVGGDELRLSLTDEAGDTGRIGFRRCRARA